MIFLIQYDRKKGRLISFRPFDDSDRHIAEDERLELELRLNQLGQKDEVVLLEAASQEALRQTHRRYFETLRQLSQS